MNEDELILVVKISKETRKPEMEFKGVWKGKWVKLVRAKLPKEYRMYSLKRLKELEEVEKEIARKEAEKEIELKKESENATRKPERTIERPRRTTTVQRTGRTKKRSGKIKAGIERFKKRERADSERKTGQPDKFLVPETTAGTAKAAERSTVDEQKPSTGTTAYKGTDGRHDRS
jgi:hypothetical protein